MNVHQKEYQYFTINTSLSKLNTSLSIFQQVAFLISAMNVHHNENESYLFLPIVSWFSNDCHWS
jgi:hypothetical protein